MRRSRKSRGSISPGFQLFHQQLRSASNPTEILGAMNYLQSILCTVDHRDRINLYKAELEAAVEVRAAAGRFGEIA